LTQPHPRRDAAIDALERIAAANEAMLDTLNIAASEIIAIRKLAERLLDQVPFPPDQTVKLITDSNGRVKPEVDVHGPDLAQCEQLAGATMARLLDRFPAPPPRPILSRKRPGAEGSAEDG